LLGAGLIFLLFFGLAVASAMAVSDGEVSISAEALIVSIGAQLLFAGVATACVVARVRPSLWLGLRWPAWPWVLLIAPATVLLMWSVFAGLQLGGYMQWMERLGVEPVQETVRLLQTTSDPLILGLMALAAVVVAPVCEEVVFRGYLYPVAKRFGGAWVATVCSALVFSAAHGSLAALFPLFLFGMVLVLIYERTGSIWAPIAVHAMFNGATVAIQMAVRVFDIPIDTGS
jgi:membrane protease YdiL (CAAX protease family)